MDGNRRRTDGDVPPGHRLNDFFPSPQPLVTYHISTCPHSFEPGETVIPIAILPSLAPAVGYLRSRPDLFSGVWTEDGTSLETVQLLPGCYPNHIVLNVRGSERAARVAAPTYELLPLPSSLTSPPFSAPPLHVTDTGRPFIPKHSKIPKYYYYYYPRKCTTFLQNRPCIITAPSRCPAECPESRRLFCQTAPSPVEYSLVYYGVDGGQTSKGSPCLSISQ